ncbi:hypothetical protein CC2G_007261 [Coprinopsis cinerea AmutBmut pab1-1]|nr:hypothetical protein CC2G_007261 [Coprinopsis cinerea AmutBmut pab1-1]
MYSSTWRKSSFYGPVAFESHDDSASGRSLKRNRRLSTHHRIGSISNGSSDSSSLSLKLSRSRNSMNLNGIGPENRALSPHDLILATSRVRAPILRVFVPCTKLDSDSESLVQCEQQLVESGLWDHLSTGDIICNLGYVPSVEDNNSSEGDDPQGEFIMMRPGSRSGPGLAHSGSNTSSTKWLLFNGHILVPYTPPDLLPLTEPLNLPTPFFYAHIMPPMTNLSYIITRLPVCDDVPQLTLIHSTRKVRSPHSPNGFAMVRKWSWIARVVRLRTEADGEMGEGWFGEWILEGEGTPEGKQLLLDALKGHELGHREWELVREKSGSGKLWLRLLTI